MALPWLKITLSGSQMAPGTHETQGSLTSELDALGLKALS